MQEKRGAKPTPEATSSDAGSRRVDPGATDVASAKGNAVAPGPAADVRAPLFDAVDDASDDSFPASDAPSWTGMRAGSPRSDP